MSTASEAVPPLRQAGPPRPEAGPPAREPAGGTSAAVRDSAGSRPDPWRVVFDLVILAVVVVYLVTAPRYAGVEHLFPEAVGYPTAALAVAAASRSLVVYLRASASVRTSAAGRRAGAAGAALRRDLARYRPLAGFALVAGYAALLPVLGFRLATLLALIGGPLALGVRARRMWIVAVVAVAFTFAMAWLFSSDSGIVLPPGLWG